MNGLLLLACDHRFRVVDAVSLDFQPGERLVVRCDRCGAHTELVACTPLGPGDLAWHVLSPPA